MSSNNNNPVTIRASEEVGTPIPTYNGPLYLRHALKRYGPPTDNMADYEAPVAAQVRRWAKRLTFSLLGGFVGICIFANQIPNIFILLPLALAFFLSGIGKAEQRNAYAEWTFVGTVSALFGAASGGMGLSNYFIYLRRASIFSSEGQPFTNKGETIGLAFLVCAVGFFLLAALATLRALNWGRVIAGLVFLALSAVGVLLSGIRPLGGEQFSSRYDPMNGIHVIGDWLTIPLLCLFSVCYIWPGGAKVKQHPNQSPDLKQQ